MRLLLALALAMGCLAAPAAARDNPARDLTRTGIPGAVVLSHDGVHAAGNVRATDRFRVGSVTKTFVRRSCSSSWPSAGCRSTSRCPRPAASRCGCCSTTRAGSTTTPTIRACSSTGCSRGGNRRSWWRSRASTRRTSRPAPGSTTPNTNYVILGLVVERVTGRLARGRAGAPLGCPTRPTRSRRACAGWLPARSQNTSWAGASGALVSTARDLDRFYRALLRSPLAASP